MEETGYRSETNPNYYMTAEEMWKTVNLNTDAGIEGYEIKKKYFDYGKSKEYKKRWEKNTSNKIKCEWPPQSLKDADGDVKWPKRKNYLDDVI
jgi:hypothetical protein